MYGGVLIVIDKYIYLQLGHQHGLCRKKVSQKEEEL